MEQTISNIYNQLTELYPDESWGSKSGIFNKALNDGTITYEEYIRARAYYGQLWTYSGD